MASSKVDHARSAHFTRTGKARTPRRAGRSPGSSGRGPEASGSRAALRAVVEGVYLGQGAPQDDLRQHGAGGLVDGAADALHAHGADAAALVQVDLDVDLVAAEGVDAVGGQVGPLELPAAAGIAAVVEDHVGVEALEVIAPR